MCKGPKMERNLVGNSVAGAQEARGQEVGWGEMGWGFGDHIEEFELYHIL